ncbi:MAG: hypothetical protein JWP01_2510 [Myxococcales bacterium]|nr:hypothetical protein [Myxococcales bacterium]
MSPAAPPPPLTPEDTRVVLGQLGDLMERLVLVGGQALSFWAEHYAARFAIGEPVNSTDIDFCGLSDAVNIAAARLDGEGRVPKPFSNTPNTGIVEFVDANGYARVMDFLFDPFGLQYDEVHHWAVNVDVPHLGGTLSFKVMHPVHCLESRIANVGGLPGYQSAHAIRQARASLLCAKEYLRDVLNSGSPRAPRVVRRLNERIYRFAWGKLNAKVAFQQYQVDAFEAVLVDDALGHEFNQIRYPQMCANLERKRVRWASRASTVTPA